MHLFTAKQLTAQCVVHHITEESTLTHSMCAVHVFTCSISIAHLDYVANSYTSKELTTSLLLRGMSASALQGSLTFHLLCCDVLQASTNLHILCLCCAVLHCRGGHSDRGGSRLCPRQGWCRAAATRMLSCDCWQERLAQAHQVLLWCQISVDQGADEQYSHR